MESDLDSDLRYFQAIPWTRKVLENPNYTAIPTPPRKWKESKEDALVAETLKTKDTVPAWLTLQRKVSHAEKLITEIRFLLSLGYAVNGYTNLVHGGMIGLIIDEAMGSILQLNANAGNEDMKSFVVTAYLKTTYLRPIPTPSIVMVTAKLREIKGRKIFMEAVVTDENGDAMAKGEALWIHAREPQTKL